MKLGRKTADPRRRSGELKKLVEESAYRAAAIIRGDTQHATEPVEVEPAASRHHESWVRRTIRATSHHQTVKASKGASFKDRIARVRYRQHRKPCGGRAQGRGVGLRIGGWRSTPASRRIAPSLPAPCGLTAPTTACHWLRGGRYHTVCVRRLCKMNDALQI